MRCFLESRLEIQRGGRLFRNIFKPYEAEMKTYSCELAWVLIDEQAKSQTAASRREPGHRRQLPTGQKALRTVLVTTG